MDQQSCYFGALLEGQSFDPSTKQPTCSRICSGNARAKVGYRQVCRENGLRRRPSPKGDRQRTLVKLSKRRSSTITGDGAGELHVNGASTTPRSSNAKMSERSRSGFQVYTRMTPEPLVLQNQYQTYEPNIELDCPRVDLCNDVLDAPYIPIETLDKTYLQRERTNFLVTAESRSARNINPTEASIVPTADSAKFVSSKGSVNATKYLRE